MNRHQRRRQAAIKRSVKFVRDYVYHLPETTDPFAASVMHWVREHDHWCAIFTGNDCNCNPTSRFFAEPQRS